MWRMWLCNYRRRKTQAYSNLRAKKEHTFIITALEKVRKLNALSQGLHITEDDLINQIKAKLSKFTVDPDFYNLLEALAQEEDEVVAKDEAKSHARDIGG